MTDLEQLRELIDERDERYEARFRSIEGSMASGFASAKEAVAAALAAAKEAVAAAFESAKEAINKSEAATERRFESVNEFRLQLKDQQSTFMPRAESNNRYDQVRDLLDAQAERINELEKGASRDSGAEKSTGSSQQQNRYTLQLTISTVISLVAILWAIFGKR